jgi:Ca-activated chloride channel homolog
MFRQISKALRIPRTLALLLAAVFCSAPALAQTASPPNAVIVLDGSGSMWGIMEGDKEAKFYTSRTVLGELLLKASPQSRIGFTALGHRRKGDCSDIEVMAPP